MTWNSDQTQSISRYSDGKNNFRHRMEVEHCIRAHSEESRNFFHRIKEPVDKGWPEDMVGVTAANQDAHCTAQARQRKQR